MATGAGLRKDRRASRSVLAFRLPVSHTGVLMHGRKTLFGNRRGGISASSIQRDATMSTAETLAKALCSTFCEAITVNPVPCGFAVSAAFTDKATATGMGDCREIGGH